MRVTFTLGRSFHTQPNISLLISLLSLPIFLVSVWFGTRYGRPVQRATVGYASGDNLTSNRPHTKQ